MPETRAPLPTTIEELHAVQLERQALFEAQEPVCEISSRLLQPELALQLPRPNLQNDAQCVHGVLQRRRATERAVLRP
jgi:hypothetical protein